MHPHGNVSLIESLAFLSEAGRAEALEGYTDQEIENLLWDWRANARPNQIRPSGEWRYWVVLAGRGFGKTRTGAETVRELVNEGYRIIHLVAPTAADARDVMVQGESGLLNCFPPGQRPNYEPSKRLVTFSNGAVARLFSADEPERLRGPQCEAFWADELCAWRFIQEAWDNLSFGFRLGKDPRGIITTTPKPIQQLKDLITHSATVVTRASTYENRANLAPGFFQDVIRRYEGTRLGRQELNAEILEDVQGALWTRGAIDKLRVGFGHQPQLVRAVVGIDPAVTALETSDETGIVCVALGADGHVYVLDDASLRGSPIEWARAAIGLYEKWHCDRIVGEVNMGGDLVGRNLHATNPAIPFRAVRATRGKMVRAEPVASLYERGLVHHVGTFVQMEEQMCNYVPGVTGKSPDRMDALVWAVYELLFDFDQQPGVFPLGNRVTISRF